MEVHNLDLLFKANMALRIRFLKNTSEYIYLKDDGDEKSHCRIQEPIHCKKSPQNPEIKHPNIGIIIIIMIEEDE